MSFPSAGAVSAPDPRPPTQPSSATPCQEQWGCSPRPGGAPGGYPGSATSDGVYWKVRTHKALKPLQSRTRHHCSILQCTPLPPEVCSQTRSLPLLKTSQSPNKTSGRTRRHSQAAGCCLSKRLPTRQAAGAPAVWKGPGCQRHAGSRRSCLQETAASQRRRNWQPVLLIE